MDPTPPRIPPEIMDSILRILRDDAPTLKVCSLVCRAWVPATRSHLFRRIQLVSTKFKTFRRLSDSPHATINRHVSILQVTSLDLSSPLRWRDLYRLPPFPFIDTLTIEGLQDFYKRDSGLDSSRLRDRFGATAVLGLWHCRFKFVHSFNDVLSAFPLLRHLDIFDQDISYSPVMQGLQPPLPSISIDRSGFGGKRTIKWLLKAPHLHLHTLRLGWSRDADTDLYRQLVRKLGPSLQKLYLEDLYSPGQTLDDLDLSLNTELRAIQFEHGPDFGLSPVVSTQWMNELLRQVSSPYLESVVIWISAESMYRPQLEISGLRPLDETLGQPRFSHLRKVEFLIPEYQDSESPRATSRWIKEQMPMSSSRGILTITLVMAVGFDYPYVFGGWHGALYRMRFYAENRDTTAT